MVHKINKSAMKAPRHWPKPNGAPVVSLSHQTPTKKGFPKIIFAEALLPRLDNYLTQSFESYGREIETGGMLIGEFSSAKGVPTFKIHGMIEAGPNAECSSDSVLFDAEYQMRMLGAIRRRHSKATNMGCFHVHPGRMDECSAGDYLADLVAVRESDTKALVFVIITVENPQQDPNSVYFGPLKIDFFVLA